VDGILDRVFGQSGGKPAPRAKGGPR